MHWHVQTGLTTQTGVTHHQNLFWRRSFNPVDMAAHAFLLTAVIFHLGIHAAYASFFCNSCRAVPGGTCDAGFDSDDCNYDSEALNEELGTEFYCSDLRSLGAGRSLRSGVSTVPLPLHQPPSTNPPNPPSDSPPFDPRRVPLPSVLTVLGLFTF